MKVNKVIKELKNNGKCLSSFVEYGNVEVTLFDFSAWDSNRDDDCDILEDIEFEKDNNRIVLY